MGNESFHNSRFLYTKLQMHFHIQIYRSTWILKDIKEYRKVYIVNVMVVLTIKVCLRDNINMCYSQVTTRPMIENFGRGQSLTERSNIFNSCQNCIRQARKVKYRHLYLETIIHRISKFVFTSSIKHRFVIVDWNQNKGKIKCFGNFMSNWTI